MGKRDVVKISRFQRCEKDLKAGGFYITIQLGNGVKPALFVLTDTQDAKVHLSTITQLEAFSRAVNMLRSL